MRSELLTIAGVTFGLVAVSGSAPAPQYGGDDCGGITTVYVTIAPPVEGADSNVQATTTIAQYLGGLNPTADVPAVVTSSNSPTSTTESIGSSSNITSTEVFTITLHETIFITDSLIGLDQTETDSIVIVSPTTSTGYGGTKTHNNLSPSVNMDVTTQPYTFDTAAYLPTTAASSSDSTDSLSDSIVYVYETIDVIPVPYTPTPVTKIAAASTGGRLNVESSYATGSYVASSASSSVVNSFSAIASSIESSAATSSTVTSSLASYRKNHSSARAGRWNSTRCSEHAPNSGPSGYRSSPIIVLTSSLTSNSSSILSTLDVLTSSSSADSTVSVSSAISGLTATPGSSATSSFTLPSSSYSSATSSALVGSSSSTIPTLPFGYGPVVIPSVSSSSGASSSSDTSQSASSLAGSTFSSSVASGSFSSAMLSATSSSFASSTTSAEITSLLRANSSSSSSHPPVSSKSSIPSFDSSSSSTNPLSSFESVSPTKSTTTVGSNTISSSSSSASPMNCGEQGDFTLDFDDLPPLAAPSDTPGAEPLFAAYHQFYFDADFFVVPPPTDPYLPASGKLLLEHVPLNGSDNAGRLGNGYTETSGCFNFNARGASLGCNSTGPDCDWEVTGLRYDFGTKIESYVTGQNLTTPACPALKSCSLVHVIFDGTFKNLTSLLIKGTVAGADKTWWMDSVELSWYDNSCSIGLCRANFPRFLK